MAVVVRLGSCPSWLGIYIVGNDEPPAGRRCSRVAELTRFRTVGSLAGLSAGGRGCPRRGPGSAVGDGGPPQGSGWRTRGLACSGRGGGAADLGGFRTCSPSITSPARARHPRPAGRVLRAGSSPWFRRHRRDLPWRPLPGEAANAYLVLVSELMLQQTRVETVLRYFNRFVDRFPTPAALAAADEQEVLGAWAGLGYYRRARNLHGAAKAVAERFGGEVPGAVEELLTLPGVGRYTAGAVASIGFGVAAPILDGNVMRVLAQAARGGGAGRQTRDAEAAVGGGGGHDPSRRGPWPKSGGSRRGPRLRPGPGGEQRRPASARPPRRSASRARCGRIAARRARRWSTLLPRKSPKKPPTRVTHHVLAVEKGGAWLFEQRPVTKGDVGGDVAAADAGGRRGGRRVDPSGDSGSKPERAEPVRLVRARHDAPAWSRCGSRGRA